MSDGPDHPAPTDAYRRRAVAPVECYPAASVPAVALAPLRAALAEAALVGRIVVPPREARAFEAAAGDFFRIACPEGSQVGDLNLWNAADLDERFFSGKTRALHGTHLTAGHRLWSSLPHLRPMATIVEDSLGWYGRDGYGCGVHDVIGTRCDPYTHRLLSGGDYHHCCHSNLTRVLAEARGLAPGEAERLVHDVLNVFMCTGFDRESGRYLMKASPARAGDFLLFFAEIDLVGALSACPGGDCGAEHSSDAARCFPLVVELLRPEAPPDDWAPPERNGFPGPW